ncbi:elongation factor 1-delta isoform 3-T4 [Discoglossus pictus]
MRTRKHQSPVENTWVDKHKNDEAPRVNCAAQPGPTATTALCSHEKVAAKAANGVNLHESGENLNVDQKKINGKKQKRRKRSPKNKALLPKVDYALVGMMEEKVWFDKYVYEEAECAYYTKLAADQAKALETKPLTIKSGLKAKKTVEETDKTKKRTITNCSHGSNSACHHVDNGIWINKFDFDDAESQFVMRFVSPDVPRALDLSLGSQRSQATNSTQRTPDEGYISATATPATPSSGSLVTLGAAAAPIATDQTVNGKPHWAGLQDLMAEVWLEKPLYDQAERFFYENLALRQSVVKSEQPPHWSVHSGKKGKRDKWNRKPSGKQTITKKREFPSIPEENCGLLHCPVYYFLHNDSEKVWLDKSTYDKAEARYYAAQSQNIQTNNAKSSVAQPPRKSKNKHHAPPNNSEKMAATYMSTERVWFDKSKYDDAERQYYEQLSLKQTPATPNQQLRTVLHSPKEAQPALPQSQSELCTSTAAAPNNGDNSDLAARVTSLEQENKNLHNVVKNLQQAISKLESRLTTLEKSATSRQSAPSPAARAAVPVQKVTPAAKEEVEEDDDDDIDLFGSDDEEDAEAERIKEERLRQYAEKKSKKPGVIPKSSILLDVKPWDDETDMAKLEECVRTVQMDGLLWGSSKLVPVGYGIKKLQIQCVVEDDKVGTDLLEEEITKFEDYVQSVDIAAFNKI